MLITSLVDVAAVYWLSTAKGLLFVVVTTLLLVVALRGVPGEVASRPVVPRMESVLAASPGKRVWLYGFAVMVTVAMLLVRAGIAVSFGEQSLLILFMFPIILSAIAGGIGPGLVATLIAALGAAHCLPPANIFMIVQSHDVFQWSFFVVIGVLVSILSEMLHRLRRHSEASLQLQAVTLASIGEGVMTTDTLGQVTFLNPEAEQLTGWTNDEALGLPMTSVFRMVDERSRQPVEDPVHTVLAGGEAVDSANHALLLTRDGRELPVQNSGAPIRLADGTMLGVVLVFRDVGGRLMAENALRESEKRFRDIAEISADWIWELDSEGRYTFASENVHNLLGFSAEEIIGKTPFDLMPPEEAARMRAEFAAIVARRDAFRDLDNLNQRKDGGLRHVLSSGVPILDEQGTLRGYRGLDRDVTAQRQAEEALRESLAEKVALLREVHHRVKNNLQIVASLLNLQADRIANPEAVAALLDTRSRVHSMALLHEVLYRSESLARINLAAYVEELSIQLLRVFGQLAGRVQVERRVAAIDLFLEQAVPCGLIINELVTNALKYGFPDEKTGRVLVEVARNEGWIDLAVSDNGAGLPHGFDPAVSSTLGLQLAMNLAGQLGGELEWEKGAEGGALFRVRFPAPETTGQGEIL
jgi:PAS domain S-box-containing protein